MWGCGRGALNVELMVSEGKWEGLICGIAPPYCVSWHSVKMTPPPLMRVSDSIVQEAILLHSDFLNIQSTVTLQLTWRTIC